MLAVDDLSFAYRRDGECVISGLSHEFVPGALTAVTGPSGTGKSTLLYLLGLMLRPRSGAVLLDGRRLDRLPDATRAAIRARSFGFVFQDASLDPARRILDSVCEPAVYAGARRRAIVPRARALLHELGVGSRADHRPGEISGGQAQRVAVARSLVAEPVVILADEPTGNLDHENASTVLDALRHASGRPRTVVIATHDPFVVEQSDHVLRL